MTKILSKSLNFGRVVAVLGYRSSCLGCGEASEWRYKNKLWAGGFGELDVDVRHFKLALHLFF